MMFKVLETFEAETPSGTLTLKEGQKVRLSKDEAILLIEEGKITPIEKIVYRIYSNILEDFLYVVETDQDMHSLRSRCVQEAIYTASEIKELKKLSTKDLKEIHKVKETFPESIIEGINSKGDK